MGYRLLGSPAIGKKDASYCDGVRCSALVAESDDGLHMLLVYVSLTPIPKNSIELLGYEDVVFHELKFYISIVPIDAEGGKPVEYFDGRYTRKFISDEIRREILAVAREMIKNIVISVSPDAIVRFTHCQNPPPKALKKHHRISETLSRNGYPLIQSGKTQSLSIYWYHAKVVKDNN